MTESIFADLVSLSWLFILTAVVSLSLNDINRRLRALEEKHDETGDEHE